MTTTFSFKALKAPLALKRLYIIAIMSIWVPYGSVVRAFSMQAEKDSGSNPAAVDIKFKLSALVQQAHPLYRSTGNTNPGERVLLSFFFLDSPLISNLIENLNIFCQDEAAPSSPPPPPLSRHC
ncbi:hypothetical protein GQX74_007230 [Glossina fuscipes]|nr:hypothetical protein GQX74_007230 [Glossina fuscipes]